MNKRESVKYDLINAINILEHWDKFGKKVSKFTNIFSDSVHIYNVKDINYILNSDHISRLDIINIGKRSLVEIPNTGWVEVVYNNGSPYKITKAFKLSIDLKHYLLDDIDELTDFIIDHDCRLETLVPWQHKICKIKESIDSINPTNAVIQILEDYVEKDSLDVDNFINTVYDQIKQQEIEAYLNKV